MVSTRPGKRRRNDDPKPPRKRTRLQHEDSERDPRDGSDDDSDDEDVIDQFRRVQIVQRFGQGNSGNVAEMKDTRTGVTYVRKWVMVLKSYNTDSDKQRQAFEYELDLLRNLTSSDLEMSLGTRQPRRPIGFYRRHNDNPLFLNTTPCPFDNHRGPLLANLETQVLQ